MHAQAPNERSSCLSEDLPRFLVARACRAAPDGRDLLLFECLNNKPSANTDQIVVREDGIHCNTHLLFTEDTVVTNSKTNATRGGGGARAVAAADEEETPTSTSSGSSTSSHHCLDHSIKQRSWAITITNNCNASKRIFASMSEELANYIVKAAKCLMATMTSVLLVGTHLWCFLAMDQTHGLSWAIVHQQNFVQWHKPSISPKKKIIMSAAGKQSSGLRKQMHWRLLHICAGRYKAVVCLCGVFALERRARKPRKLMSSAQTQCSNQIIKQKDSSFRNSEYITY